MDTLGIELVVGDALIVGLVDIEGSELTLGTTEDVTDGRLDGDRLGLNDGRAEIVGLDEMEGAAEMVG